MKHLFYVLLFSLCVQGCATNSFVLTKPHLYSQTYIESIKAVDTALKQSNMAVIESQEQTNSYWVKVCYAAQGDQDITYSNNASLSNDLIHTADIYIKRIDENTTEIKVIEEEQSGLLSSADKQHLARDFYRKLNRIIDLEDESAH